MLWASAVIEASEAASGSAFTLARYVGRLAGHSSVYGAVLATGCRGPGYVAQRSGRVMMCILFFVATGYLTDRLMGASGAASTRLGTLVGALLTIAVTLAGTVAVSRRLGWYRS